MFTSFRHCMLCQKCSCKYYLMLYALLVRRAVCDVDQLDRPHRHGRVSFTRRVGRRRHQVRRHCPAVRQRSWGHVSHRQVQTVSASKTSFLHHQHSSAVRSPLRTCTFRVFDFDFLVFMSVVFCSHYCIMSYCCCCSCSYSCCC